MSFFVSIQNFFTLGDPKIRKKLLKKFSQYLTRNDKEKCAQSSALINYPLCIFESLSNKYLEVSHFLMVKRVCAQLRLLNKYSNRLIIKNKVYVLKAVKVCEFCNIGEQNIMHWLCDCPLFDDIKREC